MMLNDYYHGFLDNFQTDPCLLTHIHHYHEHGSVKPKQKQAFTVQKSIQKMSQNI